MRCYGLDPESSMENKRWLQKVEQTMMEITTGTPAEYVASEVIHVRGETDQ